MRVFPQRKSDFVAALLFISTCGWSAQAAETGVVNPVPSAKVAVPAGDGRIVPPTLAGGIRIFSQTQCTPVQTDFCKFEASQPFSPIRLLSFVIPGPGTVVATANGGFWCKNSSASTELQARIQIVDGVATATTQTEPASILYVNTSSANVTNMGHTRVFKYTTGGNKKLVLKAVLLAPFAPAGFNCGWASASITATYYPN